MRFFDALDALALPPGVAILRASRRTTFSSTLQAHTALI